MRNPRTLLLLVLPVMLAATFASATCQTLTCINPANIEFYNGCISQTSGADRGELCTIVIPILNNSGGTLRHVWAEVINESTGGLAGTCINIGNTTALETNTQAGVGGWAVVDTATIKTRHTFVLGPNVTCSWTGGTQLKLEIDVHSEDASYQANTTDVYHFVEADLPITYNNQAVSSTYVMPPEVCYLAETNQGGCIRHSWSKTNIGGTSTEVPHYRLYVGTPTGNGHPLDSHIANSTGPGFCDVQGTNANTPVSCNCSESGSCDAMYGTGGSNPSHRYSDDCFAYPSSYYFKISAHQPCANLTNAPGAEGTLGCTNSCQSSNPGEVPYGGGSCPPM